MFEEQRRRVERVLDSWLLRPVDHIGSTAVPSLAAKPIIDMLAVVGDIDAKTDAVPAMHSIAWVHAPEPLDRAERKVSFCFPTVARRTHHLHIVEERCAEWPKWLAFRDYLIDHPDVASTYADLKQQLAAEHGGDPNDRQAYRLGKTTFCESVTARARSEGYDPRAR
jgi:GrpB-like predicted nucleotidyltransferase (UPF0157 family)